MLLKSIYVTAAFPEENPCAVPSAECALTKQFCLHVTRFIPRLKPFPRYLMLDLNSFCFPFTFPLICLTQFSRLTGSAQRRSGGREHYF